jgi:hypothetical protein
MTTRNDHFLQMAERLKLFILTNHCYPSYGHKGDHNHESQRLGTWVANQRQHHCRGNLLPHRVAALESVDPNFFARTGRGRRVQPLSWDIFVRRNGPSQKAAIKYFTDHQGRPYRPDQVAKQEVRRGPSYRRQRTGGTAGSVV